MSQGESNSAPKVVPIRPAAAPTAPRTRSARLAGRSARGLPEILLPDETERREALPLLALSREELELAILRGARCLVTFTEDEPEQPYLLGVVAPLPEKSPEEEPAEARSEALEGILPEAPAHIERDGERLIVEADKELVLRCGEAEVVLREDGKIRISGVDVVSRARRRQRIKGGSVLIN